MMKTRKKKGKIHKRCYLFFILIGVFITNCSEPTGIFIDVKNEAIVSCNGLGLNEIRIEDDSSEVTLFGTEPVIHFNRVNRVLRTTMYGEDISDYKLELKPNKLYRITKPGGYDRGSIIITFRTNGLGDIIQASSRDCN